MIRIRPGQSWKHDPRLKAALLEGHGLLAHLAKGAFDAVALEVDGFDLTKGRAEGELLPALEELLRGVAGLVGGATVATVPFRDGSLEVVLRRRERSVLITVVEFSPLSRVLARDVEVEIDALAAAALEASADFVRELLALLPGPGEPARRSRELRGLRAATRDLRRAGASAGPAKKAEMERNHPSDRLEFGSEASRGAPACLVTLHDDEGVLLGYEGGRPDIGSLLVPGTLKLLAPDGKELAFWTGMPFLALRDLRGASAAILAALRNREAKANLSLPRGTRTLSVVLDLVRGTVEGPGLPAMLCPALGLVRAIAEAASAFARSARRLNPRQGENGHLAELESAAADHLAQADELERSDVTAQGIEPLPKVRSGRPPERPLGPGRLRRLSFKRIFEAEVGPPATSGILETHGLVVFAGEARVLAFELETGKLRWSAPGGKGAWPVPGAVAVQRDGTLCVHEFASGSVRFEALLDHDPSNVVALGRSTLVAVLGGEVLGLDSGTGARRFRLAPPGATRLFAAAAGERVVFGADTGFVYGVGTDGTVTFRLLGPGPVARQPALCAGLWLFTCAAGPGAALLAVDPGTSQRRWEAPLDFMPTAGPLPWLRRIAISGALAGEPMVAALSAEGAPAWVSSPSLVGAPTLAVAGRLLVGRGTDGALLALGSDGSAHWSRAAVPGGHPPASLPPAVARGTVIAAYDGLAAFEARTGEPVGAIPGVSPARLAVDAALNVLTIDGDGLASGFRLSTHLSVVDGS